MVLRSSFCCSLLLGIAVLLGFPSLSEAQLTFVKHNGRDYVTARSMQAYYGFSKVTTSGGTVAFDSAKTRMWARSGSKELRMRAGKRGKIVKFILSWPVSYKGSDYLFSKLDVAKLIHPILKPSGINSRFTTVVIDAGHGGHDSGARGKFGYEKNFNLDLARRLKKRLLKAGLKVKMTRNSDRYLTLGQRVAIANSTPSSIFVSLHFNSASSAASGIETFALSPKGGEATFRGSRKSDWSSYAGNSRDSENIALATAIQGYTLQSLRGVDRGIKRARYKVLRGCNRPGALFEGGFLTNTSEARKVASAAYREKMAAALARAIINYRKATR